MSGSETIVWRPTSHLMIGVLLFLSDILCECVRLKIITYDQIARRLVTRQARPNLTSPSISESPWPAGSEELQKNGQPFLSRISEECLKALEIINLKVEAFHSAKLRSMFAFLQEEYIDIAMKHEASIGRSLNIKGLQNRYCSLLHSTRDVDRDKRRACIFARKSLHVSQTKEKSQGCGKGFRNYLVRSLVRDQIQLKDNE